MATDGSRVEGLGLGLAIVKSLVRAHGGSVSAHSDGKGRGSTFFIRLPAGRRVVAPAAVDAPRAAPSVPGQRILVVDDNEDAATVLGETLRMLGYETRVVLSGLEVADLVAAFRPQVVLLDLGLPGMDGFEVARRLRANAEWASVCLVAVTGYGREADRERARQAGFDHHMVKPVDIDVLDRWLAAHFAQR